MMFMLFLVQHTQTPTTERTGHIYMIRHMMNGQIKVVVLFCLLYMKI